MTIGGRSGCILLTSHWYSKIQLFRLDSHVFVKIV